MPYRDPAIHKLLLRALYHPVPLRASEKRHLLRAIGVTVDECRMQIAEHEAEGGPPCQCPTCGPARAALADLEP